MPKNSYSYTEVHPAKQRFLGSIISNYPAVTTQQLNDIVMALTTLEKNANNLQASATEPEAIRAAAKACYLFASAWYKLIQTYPNAGNQEGEDPDPRILLLGIALKYLKIAHSLQHQYISATNNLHVFTYYVRTVATYLTINNHLQCSEKNAATISELDVLELTIRQDKNKLATLAIKYSRAANSVLDVEVRLFLQQRAYLCFMEAFDYLQSQNSFDFAFIRAFNNFNVKLNESFAIIEASNPEFAAKIREYQAKLADIPMPSRPALQDQGAVSRVSEESAESAHTLDSYAAAEDDFPPKPPYVTPSTSGLRHRKKFDA